VADRHDADRPGHSLAMQIGIAVAALVLIAATWMFTLVSMDTEGREARTRVEGNAANLALAVEWQLNRQLQAVDQTLQNLATAWKTDPIKFDPNDWRRRSALAADVSLQVFLLDSQGFVMSATRPDLMGVDMSHLDYFLAQRSGRTKGLFVGPAIRWKTTGRWEINLSRRLEGPDGGFAGVIVGTYDPWALTSLLEQMDLGPRGLIALIGSDGAVRALVSPGQVAPGEDVSGSEMFKSAMQLPQGSWTGPSAPDGLVRVHAFRRLRDEDLTIVIGIGRDDALQTATIWANNALLFAGGVTAAVLLMAALLIREVRAGRGRELRLARDRQVIEAAYGALEAAKESAEAKTAQIEATLAGMSDGVMVLDADLRLVQWNERFAERCGVPRDLLRIGQRMEVLLRAQALAGEFGDLDDVELEVQRRIVELRAQRGTSVNERMRPDEGTLELRRSRLPGGGIVTLYTDVTARKRAADAQQEARRLAEEATREKSRFVAIVSHEIRTPLNAVINSLALLDESGLSASQHRLAVNARQAGDALMELVTDILELSKSDAGQLAVRPTAFELHPLLDGVLAMFRTLAASRGVQLAVEVLPDVPQRLWADSGRLRQVMMNLVSNAAKFSRPGQVTIAASTIRVEGQPQLLLEVRDQGPRIPDSELEQLFQPFSRLDNARDTGAPGTGLGLVICERLALLMGGQIGLREVPTSSGAGGNGFWVTLPLETVVPANTVAAGAAISLVRRQRAVVLIVEDIAANHIVTAMLLRREGHRVDIAESGLQAIAAVQSVPYDMVFMDLIMPGMNGYEATRRIRAMSGPAAVMPIVALTANTAPEDRARCLAAGMDEMLGKPVRPQDMLMMLHAVVHASRPKLASPSVSAPPLVERKADQGPVLNAARLADLRQGLPAATVVSLIDQCLADMRKRMPGLQAALTQGVARDIESAAHALAGMSGTYGLAAMDRRMRRIILLAREGDLAAAAVAAQGMEADLAEAAEAIRMHLRAAAA